MNTVNKIYGFLGGKKFIVALVGMLAVYLSRKTGVDIKPEDVASATNHAYAIAAIVSSYVVGQGIADAGSKGITSSVAALAVSEDEKK